MEVLQGHWVSKQEVFDELSNEFADLVSRLCQNASQAAILGDKFQGVIEAAQAAAIERYEGRRIE